MNPIDIIVKNSPHLSWIKDRTLFLTIHGSHSYGLNVETSDTDFKGFCIPPKEYYFGNQHFEQAELKDPNPDTTIYSIKKFFALAADANPSILETLFTDPCHHIHVSKLGEEVLANRELFLSKKAHYTFSGYAISQLQKLKLHRAWVRNPVEVKPERKDFGLPEQTLIPADQLMAASSEIEKELSKFNLDFMEELREDVKIQTVDVMKKMISELKITSEDKWASAARKVGLSDNFIEIMKMERRYSSEKKKYDQFQQWKKNRNKERYAMEEKFGYDGKFGLHLIRLLKCGIELLETGKLNVMRVDREELLAIRRGEISFDKLIELAENLEARLKQAYLNCNVLPKIPDRKKIDELLINITERSFR